MVMNPSSDTFPLASRAPMGVSPWSNPDGLYRVMNCPSLDTAVTAYDWLGASPPVAVAAVFTVTHRGSARYVRMSAAVNPAGGVVLTKVNSSAGMAAMVSTASPGLGTSAL